MTLHHPFTVVAVQLAGRPGPSTCLQGVRGRQLQALDVSAGTWSYSGRCRRVCVCEAHYLTPPHPFTVAAVQLIGHAGPGGHHEDVRGRRGAALEGSAGT